MRRQWICHGHWSLPVGRSHFGAAAEYVVSFRKLAERNRLLFGALSMVATVLVIGFVAVTIALTREQAARREADKARQDAETDKTRSEEVTLFLRKMLMGAGPSMALTRDTTVLREILDKTTERLALELTNQPRSRRTCGPSWGRCTGILAENAQAEAMFREALTNRIKLSGAESEAASDVMHELGQVLNVQYKTDEAESCVRRALAVRQKIVRGEKP